MSSVLMHLKAGMSPEQLAKLDGNRGRGSSNGQRRRQDDHDAFQRAKAVDTGRVVDALGLDRPNSHKPHLVTCPGCGADSGCEIQERGGLLCYHDSCSGKGRNGWRSNVDLVAEVQSLEPVEAVNWLAERFEFKGIEPPDADAEPDEGTPEAQTAEVSAPPKRAESTPTTPAGIVAQWQAVGPLVRIPTGIKHLDQKCRGGLPIPWRVMIVGAPSAGKTAAGMVVADYMARTAGDAGLCVGTLAVDEEPDDLTVRFAQMAGYTVAQAEARDPTVLVQMAADLAGLRVRLYDSTHTIESAAADLAAWAKAESRRAALFIDSLQAARSEAALVADTPRTIVEANVVAMRAASTDHRMLVVATSEANRASYRSDAAADTSNDLAAGAESRAIEFGAQTQLMLRTPKGHADVIHVRVAKNRRADRGEFWLRFDGERHTVTECDDPANDPAAAAERREQAQAKVRAGVENDIRTIAKVCAQHPTGLGEVDLRAAVKGAGHSWGRDRFNAARCGLTDGRDGVRLVDRTPDSKGRCWVLQPMTEANHGN